MTERKSFKVFVGIDDNDGRPYPWTAAFMKHDCRFYILEWLGDDAMAGKVQIRTATLTLTQPKKRKRA